MSNFNMINETWLSNKLAWLLDSSINNGLKHRFAEEFLKKIFSKELEYKNIDFQSFEVCREFYIQILDPNAQRKRERARRIDIVFMDLSQKTIFVIENKYDSTNSKNQLSEYMQIENLFPDCEIYYLYLAYDEKNINIQNLNESKKEIVLEKYKLASWKDDILSLIEKFTFNSYEIYRLHKLLSIDLKIEVDFTLEEIIDLSLHILNQYNEALENKKSNWVKKDFNTIENGYGYKIDFEINSKNISIEYGNRTKVQIPNILSNKQVIYFLINTMKNIFKGARKESKIDKESFMSADEVFNSIKVYKEKVDV